MINQERLTVESVHNKGEFWKPCPGTTAGYHCCGYQIVSPLTGCGMYCSYCILQVYFDHQHQVVYQNIDDLEAEVRRKMALWHGVVRFGTGEFGDSLFLDDQTGFSVRISALLASYPNALVEFKTKSMNIGNLSKIADPSKVVIGFSMNTPRMISVLEEGTTSLQQRLECAAACEAMGFLVAFHFDPMVWYPQWEPEYREVVRRIFAAIKNPDRIAWWSMGGFRTMPELKRKLRESNTHLPLFNGEMLLGEDRKLRYFRPVRVAFYTAMREEVDRHYPDTTLYLCMESPEVWEESGMGKRIPGGLVKYLDERAKIILGIGSR